MKLSDLLLATAVITTVSAQDAPFPTCEIVRPPTETVIAALEAAGEAPPEVPPTVENARLARSGMTIDVYVNIVTDEASSGNYTQAQVDEQLRLMRNAFAAWDITLVTRDIRWVVNNAWIPLEPLTQQELDMKLALRRGGYNDLNMYFVSALGRDLAGYCFYPEPNPSDYMRAIDGCTQQAATLPGGTAPGRRNGGTAIHEIGHWFGLFHVHTEGATCDAPGDFVDDTPAQKDPNWSCPVGNERQDSCPDQPGVDSVFNYMDYTDDACTDEFTPGQIERGSNMYANLRAGVADRFTAPISLGNAAINAGRNCAGQSTYIGVRRWTDGQFNVQRCEQHCRETSQFNLLRNRPACRFYNTYVQRRNGTHEFQACALYTQEWKADAARNTGQVQGRDRITISDSVMATDIDNNGVRSC
ncbi:hypothetical protein CKM354_000624900 [Cercospora kikuchii]|uniref:Peptidase M43 pregnancy-associated plasma-A domain-containing protein n=1 Tax=Cercospora kikuchii TaxID=84275 RepID=A0A9P3CRA3_9PEZI|nr:uncharacterized protein CKM354_000624900 [Cercospora kikuchii]GIZ43003.1 hypothetical protein CKM354_000624900 [Cercospora kikuchii]